MKANDITICAFPKSGITYLGWLLTSARLLHNGIKLQPTFYNIDWLLQDTHKFKGAETPSIWNDGVGSFYKTHDPSRDLNCIYLLRNPIDTLKSYFHFRRATGVKETIEQFLNQQPEAWRRHIEASLLERPDPSRSVIVVRYEDLVRAPAAMLNAIAGNLGFMFSGETVKQAVLQSSLEEMRAAENHFSQWNPIYRRYELEFVRPQTQREVNEFTPKVIERINRICQLTYQKFA